jgi:hypothetical protein
MSWFTRNLGTIGTVVGAGVGTLVGNPMLGASLGGALGGLAGSAARQDANRFSSNPADYNPNTGTAINELIRSQQGRNTQREANQMLSPYMEDTGQIEASLATRGLGANAFGRMMLEGQQAARAKLVNAVAPAQTEIENQRQSALAQLAALQQGGNKFGIEMAFGGKRENNDTANSWDDQMIGLFGNIATSYIGRGKAPVTG